MGLAEESGEIPTWKSQDAKAEFARLVRASEREDQLITNRDEPVAVLVSKKRYDELTKKSGSLIEFFRAAPFPEADIETGRDKSFPREVDL